MKYYKLMFDYENSAGNAVCTSDDLSGIDRYAFEQGNYYENWGEPFTFFFDPEQGARWTDYLSTDLGWFVISEKFKMLLEEIDTPNIQYIPVHIQNVHENSLIEGYSIANITSLLDALDLDHSDYSEFELDENEKVLSVRKYALKEKAINGSPIFRVAGSPLAIFVSERVKDEIERTAISGCSFLEVKVI